ncbi:melatonin receptor type 1B-A-like [Crassostrea angulata]|uniref:melatonin receptor type 1B-A-like n=1 Tax=Magallana angulata TaxID=2784310 RepID=UPI0022B1A46E|nr:melatonin receptor type 1B-A-like [Crassostrea angulata]
MTVLRTDPLLDTNPTLAIVYIVIVGIAILVGTCGNVLILRIFTVMRGINRPGKEFMMNLAIADLCVTAFADPLCILGSHQYKIILEIAFYQHLVLWIKSTNKSNEFVLFSLLKGVVKGEYFFTDNMWMCELVAGMCATACSCAILSLTLLSLSRYIYLCHKQLYYRLFGRVSCIVMCVGCWLMASFYEVPKFFGWVGYYFDQKNHQCISDRTANLSFTMFVCISTIVQLSMISVFYFLIFLQIWKTKRNVFKLDSDNPLRMRRAWNETVRSSKVLFCVFVVFVVCWTPYCIIMIPDVEDNFSTEVYLFLTLLAHLHSSVNCIIYTTGNKKFRGQIMRHFRCRSSVKSPVTFHMKNRFTFT